MYAIRTVQCSPMQPDALIQKMNMCAFNPFKLVQSYEYTITQDEYAISCKYCVTVRPVTSIFSGWQKCVCSVGAQTKGLKRLGAYSSTAMPRNNANPPVRSISGTQRHSWRRRASARLCTDCTVLYCSGVLAVAEHQPTTG